MALLALARAVEEAPGEVRCSLASVVVRPALVRSPWDLELEVAWMTTLFRECMRCQLDRSFEPGAPCPSFADGPRRRLLCVRSL